MRYIFVNIISTILVAAVLFMGLPCFMAGDLNHDENVDLADAIMGVRGLARTSDESGAFGENMKTAVSAVQMAAGLQTRIVPDDDAGFVKSLTNPFLISSHDVKHFAGTFEYLPAITGIFESVSLTPPLPPPRLV